LAKTKQQQHGIQMCLLGNKLLRKEKPIQFLGPTEK
jgi:hypothetical protein